MTNSKGKDFFPFGVEEQFSFVNPAVDYHLF